MPFRVTVPLIVLLAFVIVGVLGGRKETRGDPNVIRLVSSLPRSGSARGQTDTIVNGIKTALHEIEYKITLRDPVTKEEKTYEIKYLDMDDATAAEGNWTIEQEIANANQAVADPDVMAYIGTYNSGAAKVSMPIVNRANMLMISPANTSVNLTIPGAGERYEPECYRPTGKINYVRVVPNDFPQATLAAKWVKDEKMKQVYILDDGEVYGKGIADIFDKTCQELGVKVLGHQSIDSKSQEFTPMMTSIKQLAPDMIYFGGTSQTKGGQLFKDMVAVGLTCPMMGPDGTMEQALIDGVSLDNFEKAKFYATFGGLPPKQITDARGKEFIERYKQYNGGQEPKDAYATYGYECCIAVLEAMKIAGKKDRDAIRVAGIGLKNFSGATGVWSFDANGDTTNPAMSLNVVKVSEKDGKKVGEFDFVKSLSGK
ncbi:MAG: branched-chain amino acid ABC transporter substrate-binding protein [Fimbriiglobus sp.]